MTNQRLRATHAGPRREDCRCWPCRRLASCSAISAPARFTRSRPSLAPPAAPSAAATVLGALSLVLWTLFIITTVKYVLFAMRVDNDGEGGILALMALLGVKKQRRPTIVAVGLFGAALIYGDGAITPAISVLSALEGPQHGDPRGAALCRACGGGDPGRAVRHPVAGHGEDRSLVRPGDAALVRRHGADGNLRDRAPSSRAGRAQSGLWPVLSVFEWRHRLSGAGRGVSLRHRRRGALRRYGAFRQGTDQAVLVCDRLSKPDPELCRAGGARARRCADRRQHLLPALPAEFS